MQAPQSRKPNTAILGILLLLASLLQTSATSAAFTTRLPLSAELSTTIAATLFPQKVELQHDWLIAYDPSVAYLDDGRVAMHVQLGYFPAATPQGKPPTHTGHATVVGTVGYDKLNTQVLLTDTRLQEVNFSGTEPEKLQQLIATTWQQRATETMRIDLPAHPYLLTFKDGIHDIVVENNTLLVDIRFE